MRAPNSLHCSKCNNPVDWVPPRKITATWYGSYGAYGIDGRCWFDEGIEDLDDPNSVRVSVTAGWSEVGHIIVAYVTTPYFMKTAGWEKLTKQRGQRVVAAAPTPEDNRVDITVTMWEEYQGKAGTPGKPVCGITANITDEAADAWLRRLRALAPL
jgi:hypothetical protein